MSISGYTFDKAKVPAMGDSSLYHLLSLQREGVLPGRGNGMEVSINGLTCTISTGQALVQGRLIEIPSPEQVTIPGGSSGHLCLTIDLSQPNSSSGMPGQPGYTFVINQIRAEFVQNPVKDDLFNGGLIYNFSLGAITSTATQATFTKNQNSYLRAESNPADTLLFVPRKDINTVCSVFSSGNIVREFSSTGWAKIVDVPMSGATANYATFATLWSEYEHLTTYNFPDGIWGRIEPETSGLKRLAYVTFKIA